MTSPEGGLRLRRRSIEVYGIPMPKQRLATLTLTGPMDDQMVTLTADFDGLTLTRTQAGGYRREPDSAQPISPAAAQAFWNGLEALASRGLRDGGFDTLGEVVCWRFTARSGKQTYRAEGLVRDQHHVGSPPDEDSYAELAALFEALRK